VVMAAAAVTDERFGEFLRREGLHEEDLERFREEVRSAAIAGLTPAKKSARGDEQRRSRTSSANSNERKLRSPRPRPCWLGGGTLSEVCPPSP
jgi:hypothetical protein